MSASNSVPVRVWSPVVRIGHWLLVAAFGVAYYSEGEPRTVHTIAGYVIAGYVLMRVLWGFVGPSLERFDSFLCSPGVAVRYLLALPRRRARRYLGHSPAGGVMVIMLLASLAATTVAGMTLYALHDGAGPLAPLVAARGSAAEIGGPLAGEDPRVEFWEETHEVLANATLVLVVLHILGVILASRVHRENLVRAMITGNKPALDSAHERH